MAALNFPTSPTNGQTYTANGSTWTYYSATTSWEPTNVLGVNGGGTNGTATPTAGAVSYGTGSAYAFTSAGTAGQVLVSNGTSAPSFGGINGGTF